MHIDVSDAKEWDPESHERRIYRHWYETKGRHNANACDRTVLPFEVGKNIFGSVLNFEELDSVAERRCGAGHYEWKSISVEWDICRMTSSGMSRRYKEVLLIPTASADNRYNGEWSGAYTWLDVDVADAALTQAGY